MQIHQITPKHKNRSSRRIGRGGKRGTYSGRGIKGQRARAGAKIRPEERDILKRIPKLRGYKFKSFRKKPVVINLGYVARYYKEGEIVSPKSLLEKGLVYRIKGRVPQVKILGDGELKKKLIFQNVKFSKPAADKLNPFK